MVQAGAGTRGLLEWKPKPAPGAAGVQAEVDTGAAGVEAEEGNRGPPGWKPKRAPAAANGVARAGTRGSPG